eukprot:4802975-Pyramimonas_sp.AAC.1
MRQRPTIARRSARHRWTELGKLRNLALLGNVLGLCKKRPPVGARRLRAQEGAHKDAAGEARVAQHNSSARAMSTPTR